MEYTDAIRLVAGVIKQAKQDAGVVTSKKKHGVCIVGDEHRSDKCAKEFLAIMDLRLSTIPDITAVDIALEYTEYMNGR